MKRLKICSILLVLFLPTAFSFDFQFIGMTLSSPSPRFGERGPGGEGLKLGEMLAPQSVRFTAAPPLKPSRASGRVDSPESTTTNNPDARSARFHLVGTLDPDARASRLQPDNVPVESIVGCLTAGCHGDREPTKPAWQRAGRIWFDEDPHSQAYTNLLAAKSKTIGEKLLQATFASTDDIEYRRFLKDRCVSCHAAPHAPESQLVLGVDCQACHGPSSAWGTEHYAPTTLSKGPLRFEGTQRINTDDFVARAKACVACHVGDLDSPDGRKEVDHDLMAAGHPPMHFDFETFLRVYPAHWNREHDVQRFGQTVPNRRWQIGRLVSDAARLRLLASRCREAAASKRTWPELTEYSCFSCHHSLVQPSWRQARTAQKALVWDTWLVSGLQLALPEASSAGLKTRLATLQTKMVKSPDEFNAIAELAGTLAAEIEQRIQELNSTPPESPPQLLAALRSAMEESLVGYDWESSVQWLNSVTAKESALTKSFAPPVKLPAVRENLQGNFLDGPAHFDPGKIQMKRSQIEELLRKATP